MIIRGLRNIQKHMESAYHNNMTAWYENNLPEDARPNGMRKDVYISSRAREVERRRLAALAEEIRWQEEAARREYRSQLMHMAMGCDDRNCREC